MNGGFLGTLKRFVLWDYQRGSWQYDVMCGLIVAFIFLTPREVFRDQPRPKNVMMLSTGAQGSSFLIEPELLSGMDEGGRRREVERLVHEQAGGRNRSVTSVEPVYDKDEKEPRGFIVYTKP